MVHRQNTRRNRQNSRRNSRSNRKNSRRQNMRRQNQMGGKLALTPAELVDTSMKSATTASLNQGADFFGYHKAQHGGMAPVGTTGMLEDSLRGSARIAPLDVSLGEIRGMKDQVGGRRRRGRKASRKGRKASRKGHKASRKTRGHKGRKASRKMRGGVRELGSMDVNAPGMLLQGSLARQALSTMNHEWKLAEDPKAFAPRA